MRVAVFGAGGVGGYFGGRLAEAGVEVVFVARGEHLRAMRREGLRVDSIAGDFTVACVTASDDPRKLGAVDAVIVAVKGWQLDAAAAAMRPLLREGTCIVPLLNGIDAVDVLAAVYGEERVVGGTCRILSFVAGPGHIRHAGIAPAIAVGEMDGRESDRVGRLRALLGRARGIAVETPPDIRAAMWKKFLFIAAWSGLGAVTGMPVEEIRGRPETRAKLERAMREIRDLAVASGVALPETAIADALAVVDGVAPGGTPSMQRDVVAGCPSELESLTGAVVRLARTTSVPAPVNTAIYDELARVERRARGLAAEEECG